MTEPNEMQPAADVPSGVASLDLGCGRRKHPGSFGIDIMPHSDADLLHDLDSYPYPLPADRFEIIHCQDVIEHVADIPNFMEELHRLCAPGRGVVFPRLHRLLGMSRWANRHPARYEQLLAFSFPCENMHLRLEALK